MSICIFTVGIVTGSWSETNDVEGRHLKAFQSQHRRTRGNLKDITDYLEEQRGYDICDYLMKDRECAEGSGSTGTASV